MTRQMDLETNGMHAYNNKAPNLPIVRFAVRPVHSLDLGHGWKSSEKGGSNKAIRSTVTPWRRRSSAVPRGLPFFGSRGALLYFEICDLS
jgi:hypothetical protein